jgi:hypothetical protein
MMVINLDWVTPYEGTAEQWEWLKSKHHEKLSHRKEGETKHRHLKHNPHKRNCGTPAGHSGQMALRSKQGNK